MYFVNIFLIKYVDKKIVTIWCVGHYKYLLRDTTKIIIFLQRKNYTIFFLKSR